MVRISTDAELMQVGLSPKQTNLLGGKRGFFPLVCKQSKIQSEWASGPGGEDACSNVGKTKVFPAASAASI